MNNERLTPALKMHILIAFILQYVFLAGYLYQAVTWLSTIIGVPNMILGFVVWILISVYCVYVAVRLTRAAFPKRR